MKRRERKRIRALVHGRGPWKIKFGINETGNTILVYFTIYLSVSVYMWLDLIPNTVGLFIFFQIVGQFFYHFPNYWMVLSLSKLLDCSSISSKLLEGSSLNFHDQGFIRASHCISLKRFSY